MHPERPRQELRWRDDPLPELVRLGAPIAVSMVSYSLMTLVDTLLVGRLGAAALAGVGLGGVAAFGLLCFGMGLERGVKVLVSQAVGAGRREQVQAYLGAGLLLGLAVGAVLAGASTALARLVPAVASSAESGAAARDYLAIRGLAAPVVLVGCAIRETRYGQGDSRSPMIAALVANFANIALAWLLIWVLGWGVRGAAVATVLAHGIETGWLARGQARDGFGLGAARLRHLGAALRTGLPLGLQFWLEVGAFALLVAMLARMSDRDLAAHQIALQVVHFAFLPQLALGEAVSVLAGQAVGAGEDALVRPLARRALRLGLAYAGACIVVCAGLAGPLAALFTSEPELRALTATLLRVSAGFLLFDAAALVARGALYGTGDLRYATVTGVVTAWLCTPPLTALLGFRLGLGAVGGWLGLIAECVAQAALLWWRIEHGGWRGAAERSRQRLAEAEAPPTSTPLPAPAE